MGSLGDLHPFIALGRALRDLGAEVVLACAADYRSKVESAGLGFHPLRPGFEQMQLDLGMDHAQLTAKLIGRSDFLFRQLILPYVRTAYEDMMQVTADADLLLPSSLAFGARLAAEKRAIPWIGVVLQPMMFLSAYDPPVIPEAPWLSDLLRTLGPGPTRPALWMIKKAVNGLFGPLRALRAELGLAPTAQNPLFEGQFSEAGAIGLYSKLLGPAQPDYPGGSHRGIRNFRQRRRSHRAARYGFGGIFESRPGAAGVHPRQSRQPQDEGAGAPSGSPSTCTGA